MKSENTESKGNYLSSAVNRFAGSAANASGSTSAFLIALGIILLWAIAGPGSGFPNTGK